MEPKLLALRDEVVRLVSPLRIMVFSRKQTLDGTLASVKLAVIIGAGDPHAAEHRLYMELEADIPFDVVVYTAQEWEQRLRDPLSFAARIRDTGVVLYAAE